MKSINTEERLHKLLANNAYEQVMPGGDYEEEFKAILAKYNGDLYHTALAALSMGAGLAERS
jgi:hypothetical protein